MKSPVMKPIRGELINVKEAARRLKLSPSWLYTQRRKMALPFDYFQPSSGRIFFDSADIDDYLLQCRIPAAGVLIQDHKQKGECQENACKESEYQENVCEESEYQESECKKNEYQENERQDSKCQDSKCQESKCQESEYDAPVSWIDSDTARVSQWLERFISLNDNPRAARIMGAGSPYSISTIELYHNIYFHYIKGDPFCDLSISKLEQTDCLSFMSRLGMRKKDKRHGGGTIAGTRSYEIILRFIRMTFKEYGETHEGWQNPFDRIKPPKSRAPRQREILETWEIRKLFEPGVITDPLDRALASAMFWAGMRRGEIYGLKPEDLNWEMPRIIIRHAWQCYDNPKQRSLGDPKWHKIREIPFPIQLQEAIRELWAAYGEHDFVFCNAQGKLPGSKYLQRWLPQWIKAAEIDLGGRKIVPHGGRHSLVSALEDNGVSLRQIQDMLGHSDLQTTKTYLHDTADHINKMGRKIENLGEEPQGPRLVRAGENSA